MSPSFQSVNSGPPHSGIDTTVDLEAGLTHSPLPTNTPFCLGLARRGSLGEGGWKRLRIPEFTRPPGRGPSGSTTTCGRYPHPLHLEVGWQVRALKQTLGHSPNPDLEVSGHQGCGSTKKEGLVFPGSVMPAESPARFPDSLSPPPLPSIFLITDGEPEGLEATGSPCWEMGGLQL